MVLVKILDRSQPQELHSFFFFIVTALERRSGWKPKFRHPLKVVWAQNLFLHSWYLKCCQCRRDPIIVEKVRTAAVSPVHKE